MGISLKKISGYSKPFLVMDKKSLKEKGYRLVATRKVSEPRGKKSWSLLYTKYTWRKGDDVIKFKDDCPYSAVIDGKRIWGDNVRKYLYL
nr:hypothetical protein MarFTME_051 [Marseillevirus futianmevirus]